MFAACAIQWKFFQFSDGMRVVYDKTTRRLLEFSLDGEEIDEKRIYKIGLQYFFYLNMKNFFSVSQEEVSENGKPKTVATSCREILDEYLSYHRNIDHKTEGRLEIIE